MATYTLFIYAADDFDEGLPREQWARAAGGNDHTLTFSEGASGIAIKVTDDDSNFDEIDRSSQVLTEDVTVGGVTYPAGTTINTAYDLQNSDTGMRLTSIHFGTNGYSQGAVHAAVTTEILEPGETYTFDVNRTSYGNSNAYEGEYIPCLVAGTAVLTAQGPRPVETLRRGDLVCTRDAGMQPVRHIWSNRWPGTGKAAPVRIPAGTFGAHGEVLLSREHRVMVSGRFAAQICSRTDEVLVAPKFLVGAWQIRPRPVRVVSYWHLMFDSHQIIEANGLPVESYLWTVKKSEPAGAPARADLCGRLDPGHLAQSWVPARPVVRRKHLRRA